jgi:hypothetical protein
VNQTWLSVNPTSGTSTGETDTITVNYSTSSLALGTYNAVITVSDPNASNTPQTISVALTVNAAGSVRADFDHDGDVDAVDCDRFQSCMTGPQAGPPGVNCADPDMDSDNDVDLSDFGLFQRCLDGANVTADPNCAN